MVFSSFCWHLEDHWTYSINYNHLGAPKTWYGVPGSAADAFERVVRGAAPELFESQPDLLHHLVTLISPAYLMAHGVPVVRADQHEGEFVVTFPRAYHAGFNTGFNVAEAVNFATPQWLSLGRECVHAYRAVKRRQVFSHEELLVAIARECVSSPTTIDVVTARETLQQLEDVLEANRAALARLAQLGLRLSTLTDMAALSDDARACRVCNTTCFLAAVTCPCLPSRLACLDDVVAACSCPLSAKVLCCALSEDELSSLLAALAARAPAYDAWSRRVVALLGPGVVGDAPVLVPSAGVAPGEGVALADDGAGADDVDPTAAQARDRPSLVADPGTVLPAAAPAHAAIAELAVPSLSAEEQAEEARRAAVRERKLSRRSRARRDQLAKAAAEAQARQAAALASPAGLLLAGPALGVLPGAGGLAGLGGTAREDESLILAAPVPTDPLLCTCGVCLWRDAAMEPTEAGGLPVKREDDARSAVAPASRGSACIRPPLEELVRVQDDAEPAWCSDTLYEHLAGVIHAASQLRTHAVAILTTSPGTRRTNEARRASEAGRATGALAHGPTVAKDDLYSLIRSIQAQPAHVSEAVALIRLYEETTALEARVGAFVGIMTESSSASDVEAQLQHVAAHRVHLPEATRSLEAGLELIQWVIEARECIGSDATIPIADLVHLIAQGEALQRRDGVQTTSLLAALGEIALQARNWCAETALLLAGLPDEESLETMQRRVGRVSSPEQADVDRRVAEARDWEAAVSLALTPSARVSSTSKARGRGENGGVEEMDTSADACARDTGVITESASAVATAADVVATDNPAESAPRTRRRDAGNSTGPPAASASTANGGPGSRRALPIGSGANTQPSASGAAPVPPAGDRMDVDPVDDGPSALPSLRVLERLIDRARKGRVKYTRLPVLEARIYDAQQWIKRVEFAFVKKTHAVRLARILEATGGAADLVRVRNERERNLANEDRANTVYCVCRSRGTNGFMICCELCGGWFHGRCVSFAQRFADAGHASMGWGQ